jgi:transketolase
MLAKHLPRIGELGPLCDTRKMTAFHRKVRHVSYVGGHLSYVAGDGRIGDNTAPLSHKKRDMPTRRELANAIRALSMDAVQKANSGHPGAPMGMADIAEVLWRDVLKFNPGNPTWMDRDRFVLSNGHASMLLYSLLHLTGYPLSMEEIKNFRQFGSKTAGHPERETHLGIETTTGPLGQGVANAVGMALAERTLSATFNRPGHTIIDHHTYVFLGDGCMMEGISHEIASFAGMQKLGKLILVYDDNGISIDGKVAGWFRDDTAKRFEAYGWHVLPHVDGQNSDAVAAALAAARAETGRPSLICAKTVIGWGAPNKQGSASMHGEAMGNEEIAATRVHLGWTSPPFEIPADIRAAWDMREKGARVEGEWRARFAAYKNEFPALAAELERRMAGDLPGDFGDLINAYIARMQSEGKPLASRQSSQATLNTIGPALPELLGGSADLTPSNGTLRKDSVALTPETPGGNYLHFGVREFGMSAILNGITAHGGFIPYAGTFLTFSDYARNAVRMSALMRLRVIFVYTHDSIGLGEDGPTHQPIEQVASLRLIPHMDLWRPCDAVETATAWGAAIENRDGPTCLIFTRQSLAHEARLPTEIAAIKRGGYVLIDSDGPPEVIVIATGSEVGIAAEAVRTAAANGKKVRLVSMPSSTTFERQDNAYKQSVLPPSVTRRVAVEAGATGFWWRYVGLQGEVVGIDHYGASAPAKELFKAYGFTPERVAEAIAKVLIT